MKQIVIVRPGTVKPKDKEKLSKAGFVVIEHPEPTEVIVTNGNENLKAGDLLMSAMEGLAYGDSAGRRTFFEELYKRMIKNEQECLK